MTRPNVKIPNTGWCIAKSGGHWYDDCFADKKSALRAAQRMANSTRLSVDLVRVTNHGQDRWVEETIYPQSVDNPRRPPKQWMRDCVAGASGSAADPGAVCGALWYRKMSPAAKRAALAREGRRENPKEGEVVFVAQARDRSGTVLDEREIHGQHTEGLEYAAMQTAKRLARKWVGATPHVKMKMRDNPWARVFG